MPLAITSPAFQPDQPIPFTFTADDEDRSPPLRWSGVPVDAKTLALILEDPDAPGGTFVHWIAFNIPATVDHLAEGALHRGDYTDGTLQGRNSFDRLGYGGPKPPPGQTHRYVFKLFALDRQLELAPGADRAELERAMHGHIIDRAELTARYGRG